MCSFKMPPSVREGRPPYEATGSDIIETAQESRSSKILNQQLKRQSLILKEDKHQQERCSTS